eukprot:TRINITY_DN3752_c0_g1_i1.p7 TRINITY_DN3752_c0_g1~~TRINITY_DN3752_c0_g1_i1.p7  ORF type:complete len:113 (-),score=0.51 TRINITY_DN3752_c0_g1_i1:1088-1426(-)
MLHMLICLVLGIGFDFKIQSVSVFQIFRSMQYFPINYSFSVLQIIKRTKATCFVFKQVAPKKSKRNYFSHTSITGKKNVALCNSNLQISCFICNQEDFVDLCLSQSGKSEHF